jgi:hypothetical protein
VLGIVDGGHPLRDPIPVLRLRNQRITGAYGDLSFRLDRSTRYLTNRRGGASYRVLAAGNRIVFREIGLAISLFLEAFGDVDRERPDGSRWDAYMADVQDVLDGMARLDESWIPTVMPDPRELRLGLRQYYEALFAPDPKVRAELVLAGSVLLASYEQRRIDGYTGAVLALFTGRAMKRLRRQGTGAVCGWPHRLTSSLYARIATRCIAVATPAESLWIGRPQPPLAPPAPPAPPAPLAPAGPLAPLATQTRGRDPVRFPTDLDGITLPLLAALLARYDRSGGDPRRWRIRDWTSYDQRMNYIVNLIRSRQ